MKTTYVMRTVNGESVCIDKEEAWRLDSNQPPEEFVGHYVQGDIPDYLSPIDDSLVSGRRARRNDLRKNNCRPAEKGEREDAARYQRDKEAALVNRMVERMTWMGA